MKQIWLIDLPAQYAAAELFIASWSVQSGYIQIIAIFKIIIRKIMIMHIKFLLIFAQILAKELYIYI